MNKTKILILTLLCCMCTSAWGESVVPVVNGGKPTVETGKYYTFECRSASGHASTRFIGISNSQLHGQCASPVYFSFTETDGGYYIQEYSTKKYFNWNNGAVLGDEPATVWEFRNTFIVNAAGLAPVGTETGKALNNNGGTNSLQMGSFTGSGNACSHWEMVEYGEGELSEILNRRFEKPTFGGVVWTWNTGTNKFDAEGKESTDRPGRNDNKGPVLSFTDVGTVTANAGGDTSDQGGIKVYGESQVTSSLGGWAGSIEVGTGASATISYSADLKGTEPDGNATVWVDGILTITGRNSFSMNDGGAQNWFIGENGLINSTFTGVNKGNRQWNIQVIVADEPAMSGVEQKTINDARKVLVWKGDISSNINSLKVFKRDGDTYTLLEGDGLVTYDATGITINYERKINIVSKEYTLSVIGAPAGTVVSVGGEAHVNGDKFQHDVLSLSDIAPSAVDYYTYDVSLIGTNITVTYSVIPSAPADGQYYMIQNGMYTANFIKVDPNGTLDVQPLHSNDMYGIWKFVDKGGNHITLQNVATGLYLDRPSGWGVTKTGGDLVIQKNGENIYNYGIGIAGGNYMAHNNSSFVSWSTGPNTDCSWNFIPADASDPRYDIYTLSVTGDYAGTVTCTNAALLSEATVGDGRAFFLTKGAAVTGSDFVAEEIADFNRELVFNAEAKTISVVYSSTRQKHTITYNLYYNDALVKTEVFEGVIDGDPYPVCASLPDGASVTYPEGTVTKTETKDLTMTFDKFVISTVVNPTWYYIRMRGNQYAYYDESNTQSKQTPVASNVSLEDKFRWAFVGTPFGFNIINKAAKDGEGNYLLMYHNTGSEQNNVFQSEGTEFIYVEAAAQEGRDIYIKINDGGTNYINRNGGFYFWNNGGAKGEVGSAMAFELYDPANDIAELQGKTKIGATSDPDVTVIYPGEFNYTPAQIDAAIDAIDAIDVNTATTDEMETALRTYGPALRNYVSATTSYGTLATVNYTLAAEYGTIMLPSNVAKPQDLAIYSCAATDGNVLTLSTAQNFKSNTPYIVCGTTGSKYQFIGYNGATEGIKNAGLLYGTYSPITDVNAIDGKSEGRVYVLKSQGGKPGFYQLDPATTYSTLTIGANRCYLTLPAETSVKALYFDTDEVPTDIRSAVDSESSDFRTFNLAGQTVGAGFSGIVIRNGKKYLKVSSKNSPF